MKALALLASTGAATRGTPVRYRRPRVALTLVRNQPLFRRGLSAASIVRTPLVLGLPLSYEGLHCTLDQHSRGIEGTAQKPSNSGNASNCRRVICTLVMTQSQSSFGA